MEYYFDFTEDEIDMLRQSETVDDRSERIVFESDYWITTHGQQYWLRRMAEEEWRDHKIAEDLI